MAKNIHKFFVNNLKKVPWMDERTRRYAVEKANAMGLNIAYPDEVTNDQKLEEYHRELKLQPNSLLESVLRIRTFLKNLKIREFRQPIVKNDWRIIASRVTEVDAFYYPSMNAIGEFCDKTEFPKTSKCFVILLFLFIHSNFGWNPSRSSFQKRSVSRLPNRFQLT